MTGGASLQRIWEARITLQLAPTGLDLLCRPASRIDPALAAAITADKKTLIALLQAAAEQAVRATARPGKRRGGKHQKKPPMRPDPRVGAALQAFYKSRLARWDVPASPGPVPADPNADPRVAGLLNTLATMGSDWQPETMTYDQIRARSTAESFAYAEVRQVYFWELRPVEALNGRCAGCRRPLDDTPVVSFPNGVACHDIADGECLAQYGTRWHRQAAVELEQLGLMPATGWQP